MFILCIMKKYFRFYARINALKNVNTKKSIYKKHKKVNKFFTEQQNMMEGFF